MRARMSGNESSAIGSLRAINSAQSTYASSCAGGGYADCPRGPRARAGRHHHGLHQPDLTRRPLRRARADPPQERLRGERWRPRPVRIDVTLAADTCNASANNADVVLLGQRGSGAGRHQRPALVCDRHSQHAVPGQHGCGRSRTRFRRPRQSFSRRQDPTRGTWGRDAGGPASLLSCTAVSDRARRPHIMGTGPMTTTLSLDGSCWRSRAGTRIGDLLALHPLPAHPSTGLPQRLRHQRPVLVQQRLPESVRGRGRASRWRCSACSGSPSCAACRHRRGRPGSPLADSVGSYLFALHAGARRRPLPGLRRLLHPEGRLHLRA